MSVWSDIWDAVKATANTVFGPVATAGAVLGAAAGAAPSAEPGPKLLHPPPANPTPAQAAVHQLMQGPAVQPTEAIGQTAKAIVGAGPLAGSFRTPVVWAIIIVIALIGVWGLIAPGGGVAIVQRAIGGR